ncbi:MULTISPECIES: NADP-dependent oxidoreductase [Caballeronia]|uniref:NADP-dependent oxidoreductase n=1 Tax=Caballeronia TaxID=1827195 RepID=UPI001FD47781|nr:MULTISPECIES: NADP-dependent oxidoreductase [Caballeronia]MDR5799157.1 NADP-dependent oxidoreductase [Caballeronia sp. LZ001]
MKGTKMNRQVLLVSRPEKEASTSNFKLVERPLEALKAGEVRVRNLYLSLDPYMRGRMSEARSYSTPQPLNEAMIGGTAGVVVESLNPAFVVHDHVVGMSGWQEIGTSDGSDLRKVDVSKVPLSAYLGVVGMPGVTAWYGLNRIIVPVAGETIAVSAASGAVGSVVGQLAKAVGCRVIGIAGGVEKCRYVVDTLGFDACVDYKAGQLAGDLQNAAPGGIDGYFENVGGPVLDAVLQCMNAHGRIALCGMISGYQGDAAPLRWPRLLLTQRLALQGFIVTEHMDVWPQALKELAESVANKKLVYRETIVEGLENAPEAFLGLLRGLNFGKQLVKLA